MRTIFVLFLDCTCTICALNISVCDLGQGEEEFVRGCSCLWAYRRCRDRNCNHRAGRRTTVHTHERKSLEGKSLLCACSPCINIVFMVRATQRMQGPHLQPSRWPAPHSTHTCHEKESKMCNGYIATFSLRLLYSRVCRIVQRIHTLLIASHIIKTDAHSTSVNITYSALTHHYLTLFLHTGTRTGGGRAVTSA
jgi:hypothetical protein